MKNRIRTTCKYIIPLTIIGLFGYHSYSVQSKLNQKEKQTYISLKELSEIAAKIHGVEPPFLDKVMITIVDWFIPIPFINKNESLKLLAEHKNELTSKSKRIYVSESKMGEVVVTKNFNFTSSDIKESKSIPMGTIFSAFVMAPFHDSDNPNQLRFKININSMSCTAIADSILKTDYRSGNIVAKISGINCANENSKSIPLEAVGLVSGRVLILE
ncbi:TPA: hypothetical protein F8A29_11290 [Legionella pneumophila]|nr:hypothetical protein [Legionella pneumophila]HAU2543343.1 hypothetical protein [Legionella pneumophila]HAU3544127.1 hypothetical protein [Legionella pneumophila]HBD4494198.1 hypothetical protein [Legionella pneumophila]HDU8238133.1 hypothetical protein [Legionella pneumophila]